MPPDTSDTNETAGRCPCLPVVAAFAAGIVADHTWHLPRALVFAMAGILLVSLALGRRASRALRVASLLLLVATLGAASHHTAWSDRGTDSVARLLRAENRLVRLTGTVATHPAVERRRDAGRKAAWPLDDRTRVIVECESVVSDSSDVPRRLTGQIQLTTAGHLIGIGVGDRIEITGWLGRPGRARNPGGFDAERYLRLRRVDAFLYADHPDAVRHLAVSGFRPIRAINRLREHVGYQFAEHLSHENAAIGAAMILGDRSAIPVEVRDAYVASGAMHILAISGLHVGILAACVLVGLRLLHVSTSTAAITVAAIVWLYAALTNFGPPVVRASVFFTIWALGTVLLRRTSLLNVATVTALLLLLWNPLLLFDVGAQLSFLAVLGMSWSRQMFPAAKQLLTYSEESSRITKVARPIISAQILGFGIWLFTAPLIAAEFQIVSPVGFLLNVVLLPLATAVMWAGYAFFGACLAVPIAAGPPGMLFDLGLSGVNWLVITAGEWNLGHFATSSPPTWWLCGFYSLLFVGLVRPRWFGRRLRAGSVLLVWGACGLVVGWIPTAADEPELRVVVLDVGHGGAILIEAANGRTLLFDCGSMEDDRRAADAVWREMRERGRISLDAAVISHADLDHCNNAPALLRGGPVGSLLVARSFLDFEQRVVEETCEAAREARVPIRLIAAGDRLSLDPNVSISTLHPPDRPPGDDDNANSIVLRIEFAGRTLLLTGDLEGSGQEEVMAEHATRSYDVVIAPHHGGLKANTPRFSEWSNPREVVVSCGDRVNATALSGIYPASQLHFTSRTGAVIVEFDADGAVSIEPNDAGDSKKLR